MLRSMTGFASATGAFPPFSLSWELRSVNSKGQDIRLRVPDWIDGLEAQLRRKLSNATARGAITLSLRVTRADDESSSQQINAAQLESALRALVEVETRASTVGLTLAPTRAADVLMIRGVLETAPDADNPKEFIKALLAEADALIAGFNQMRENEGAALEQILASQLQEIEALTLEAKRLADTRGAAQAEVLKRNLAKVLENSDGADPDRVAQELAILAVKADVTEEIDRLRAHVDAARALIADGGAVGRKLDFLMQEFNRETNTLCSKAQHTELTRCGLAMKATIEQMREQVQNVE